MRRLALVLLLLSAPAFAQVRGWPPYFPRGRAVSSQVVAPSYLLPSDPGRMAVGVPYSLTVTAINLCDGATISVTSGTLPAGLTLSADGVISGTPTTEGASTVTVTASCPSGSASIVYRFEVEPGVAYHFGATSDTLYVRGNVSSDWDIVSVYNKNGRYDLEHLDFGTTYEIPATADTGLAQWRAGPCWPYGSSVSSWISTSHCGGLAGQFSLKFTRIASTGHGKVAANDIGSYYHDKAATARQYIIAAIPDVDHLDLFPVPYTATTAHNIWQMWTYGATDSLVYDSLGATPNTATIPVASQVFVDTYDATTNSSVTWTDLDGNALAAGGGRAVGILITEQYDVMDPSTTVRTNNPWNWSDIADVWWHQKNTYEVMAGSTVMHPVYTFYKDLSAAATLPLSMHSKALIASWDSVYYYAPGVDSIRCDPKIPGGVSFTTPKTIPAGYGNGTIANSELQESVIPAYRFCAFLKDAGADTFSVMHTLGVIPTGSDWTITFWMEAAIDYFYRVDASGYTYLNLVGNYSELLNFSGNPESDLYAQSQVNCYPFYNWQDVHSLGYGRAVTWNQVNGYWYVYIDYWRAADNELIELPSWLTGRTISTAASLNLTVAESTVPATGIHVDSDSETRGYIILKLSKP